ncbi:CopG family transcriptional regulator [Microbispora sp. NPDC046933]|uniref:ribbon-helix-helix domain-containing protein n=1 Tax=Microbispora sp. NPDC046933 TaxID=3155618 RepID=UPI00340C4683
MSRMDGDLPTSSGVPVTDELIAALAEEAEAGYDVDTLRRRGGRRPMGSAPADVVPVRLDPELRSALITRAERDHTSASEVIRRALRAWLHVA